MDEIVAGDAVDLLLQIARLKAPDQPVEAQAMLCMVIASAREIVIGEDYEDMLEDAA